MGFSLSRTRLLAVMLLALVLGLVALPAAAQGVAPEQPAVPVGCPFVLKTGVPFAWLRGQPSSVAAPVITMQPGNTVTINDPPTLAWDGVQWWVYVWPNFSAARGYYWVELNSLEPRCETPTPTLEPSPTHTPTPTPSGSGAADWQAGYVVRVRASVPFVWFRGDKETATPPIYTVFPGAQLIVVQGASKDIYDQWWWLMRDPRNNISGWVEQQTVELVGTTPPPTATPSPTPQPGSWQIGDTVRIRASVPFAWMRYNPNSTSGFSLTVYPGQELILQQGPTNDGVQNWWKVVLPNTLISGWIEANSMERVVG